MTLYSLPTSRAPVQGALSRIKADRKEVLENENGVLLVLLDLNVAFDTVDHEICLERLHEEVAPEMCAAVDEVLPD